MHYYGLLIYKERMKRNWCQAGLCAGICSVSYLSKIEQGKVIPSNEIVYLLFRKLGFSVDSDLEKESAELADYAYDLLFSGDILSLKKYKNEMSNGKFQPTSSWIDLLLICEIINDTKKPLDDYYEVCMNKRQSALQAILKENFDKAIELYPNAYVYYCAGVNAYEKGKNYTLAFEYFQTSYDLSSREGMPYLMLDSQMLIGNCYCNQHDIENMKRHYKIAERLAKAMHRKDVLDVINYNMAACQMEIGQYENAYEYFSTVDNHTMMTLHKLAICCEKMGLTDQALEALQHANQLSCEEPNESIARLMCKLVQYRLTHSDYLADPEYGVLLTDCFDLCLNSLSIGYASFHLPWVIEWCVATRQYKKSYEIMAKFPLKVYQI